MADFQFAVPIKVSKADGAAAVSLAEASRIMEQRVSKGQPLGFEGVASSTGLDRDREWMTEACLNSMAGQAPVDIIPAPAEGRHWGAEPGRELGVAKSFSVFAEGARMMLGVSGELSPSTEQGRAIYVNALAGQAYELSVMGGVTSGMEAHPETGEVAKCFTDLRLDHIAVARAGKAINPDAWLAAVSKAAAEEGETVTEAEETGTPETTEEATAEAVDPQDVQTAGEADITEAATAAREEEIDMTPEEMAALVEGAVAKSVGPLTERLAAVEEKLASKAEEVAEEAATEETEDTEDAETASEATDTETEETVDEAAPETEDEDETDERDAKIAELEARLAEQSSKADALAAKPTAGGPVSTAAAEGDEKLVSKTERPDLVRQAMDEGDPESAKRVVALRMMGMDV